MATPVSSPTSTSFSSPRLSKTKKPNPFVRFLNKIAPKNKVTNKRQLKVMPLNWVNKLGAANYDNLCPKVKTLEDTDPKTLLVRRIGEKVAAQSENQDFKYEFRVMDDDKVVNAFALPGGKLAITTGMLNKIEEYAKSDKAKNKGYQEEDIIAAVLGHEVTHAAAMHGAFKIQVDLVMRVSGFALGKIFGIVVASMIVNGQPQQARGKGARDIQYERKLMQHQIASAIEFLFTLVWRIASFFLSSAHSRSKEAEADKHGIKYMAKAGYDVRGSIALMDILTEVSGGKAKNKKVKYLGTHPLPEDRRKKNKKLVEKIQKVGVDKAFA